MINITIYKFLTVSFANRNMQISPLYQFGYFANFIPEIALYSGSKKADSLANENNKTSIPNRL